MSPLVVNECLRTPTSATGAAAIKIEARLIKVANQPKLIFRDMNLPCCWVTNSKPQLHKIMLPIVKPHGDVPVVCPSDVPVLGVVQFAFVEIAHSVL
jgi:hypothetical protein